MLPTLRVHHFFGSRHQVAGRALRVWLPALPATSPARRLQVVYLLDGQNVFDGATAFAGIGWRANATTQRLVDRGSISPPILVAIDNAGAHRLDEFTPDAWHGRGGQAAAFVHELLTAIVPFVDAHYPTRAEPAARALVGASLGGLFALHVGLAHPEVFGAVAALSPSTWWADGAVLRHVAHLPGRVPVRVWIDVGKRESPSHRRSVRTMAELLASRGWQKHRVAKKASLRHVEVAGGRHDERSWGDRFGRVLKFLLPPTRPPAPATRRARAAASPGA